MSKDNGGPAFPCPSVSQDQSTGATTIWQCDGGMTLRDYFAAKALQAIITRRGPGFMGWHPSGWDSTSAIASAAYSMADAMLAERSK